MTWLDRFRAARRAGTPLVALETVDQIETARLVADQKDPVIWWDCAAGPRGMNRSGAEACSGTFSDPYAALNLIQFLGTAARLPQGTVLLLALAHRFCDEPAVIQAVQNLRDPWKQSGSTLVLLVQPATKLPGELQQDVLTIERPLPTPPELLPMVREIAQTAAEQLGKPVPSEEIQERASEALVGLSEFAAESACALAVDDGGLTPDVLWDRKRGMVNQTPGLQLVPPGAETFDRIGGLKSIREFSDRLFRSGQPPKLVVWIDEIEKALAGAGSSSAGLGDTSGTSQDQLGVLLRYQEEMGWGGILMVGPPGSGKSMVAKAIGATHQVPTVLLDLGALKGSLVGQSEQRVRAAMRIVQALAGRDAFFVATANRLDSVPPELRRRYKYGIWFSDLPTQEERAEIWRIHLKANGFGFEKNQPEIHAVREWTGAEIRNACELAARLGITPADATGYIVPVSQSDPEGIERLRKAAEGRFLSVSYPGPYRRAGEEQKPRGRRLTNAVR